jgi:dolichol-phosphate mannosyltransferase
MISVVLPTYNERDNIVPLSLALADSLDPRGEPFEVVVVDDGSPDGTAEAVRGAAVGRPWLRLVERAERGLAGAIREGIERSAGDRIVVMDTDFNHPPDKVPVLLEALDGADLVVGSRYIPGGGMSQGRLRFRLSALYNRVAGTLLGLPTRDSLSGFLCFRRSLFQQLPKESVFVGYGDYCLLFIKAVHSSGGSIREVPVFYGTRHYGESKTRFLYHFVSYTARVLSTLFSTDGRGRR